MKQGEVVLGHKHDIYTLDMLIEGSMLITNNPEKEFVRIQAPFIFETAPGSQKFGMCETDCTFLNVLRYDEGETEDEVYNRMIGKETTCQEQ